MLHYEVPELLRLGACHLADLFALTVEMECWKGFDSRSNGKLLVGLFAAIDLGKCCSWEILCTHGARRNHDHVELL